MAEGFRFMRLGLEREGSSFACSRRPWAGAAREGGDADKKSQNRKNVYLSPYVKEPLNSKVIKSFVPELRSRYVFFEFRDSYVLCIYMNIICPFRISVSGYGTHEGNWPSWLELQNTPTASMQRGKTSPTSVQVMTLNNLMVKLQ